MQYKFRGDDGFFENVNNYHDLMIHLRRNPSSEIPPGKQNIEDIFNSESSFEAKIVLEAVKILKEKSKYQHCSSFLPYLKLPFTQLSDFLDYVKEPLPQGSEKIEEAFQEAERKDLLHFFMTLNTKYDAEIISSVLSYIPKGHDRDPFEYWEHILHSPKAGIQVPETLTNLTTLIPDYESKAMILWALISVGPLRNGFAPHFP